MLPTIPAMKNSKNRAIPRYSFISVPMTPIIIEIKMVPTKLAKSSNNDLSSFCNVFISIL